jgi:menaquinone-dependent protoporphyrinogen oxidase
MADRVAESLVERGSDAEAVDVDANRTAEAAGYVETFLDETGWEPDRVATYAGALRYSEYGFLERAVLKRIVREFTGDTDTSRDYEYTDWDAVAAFAGDVAALVASGAAAEPVARGPPTGTPEGSE